MILHPGDIAACPLRVVSRRARLRVDFAAFQIRLLSLLHISPGNWGFAASNIK